ncbi:MAG: macro domain-containing protein [Nocardioidaceae bacterium]
MHVVGPDRRAGQRDPALLESCYRRALEVADELGVTSVAFPLVSAGVYGWPLYDAARIAVGTVRADLAAGDTSVTSAVFVAFGTEAYEALTAHL